MSDRYGNDILGGGTTPAQSRRRTPQYPEVEATDGMVVEDRVDGFCGAVVGWEKSVDGMHVVLEDRRLNRRLFKLRTGGFLLEGQPVTLTRPAPVVDARLHHSNSGSRRVHQAQAKVALPSRIWVEGVHDAAIVEQVWGHDLRVEGIVVEYLEGLDHLPQRVAEFQPGPQRRIGVLADHLITGSKESRLSAGLGPHVRVTGHPFVDIWAAVKPASVGIRAWPEVPRGEDWKTGVCQRLGWADPQAAWRKIYSSVTTFRDLDSTLIGAVESLIDFVTEPQFGND